ncbi:hypothetical protein NDR87_26300 [Nocardia sp. CDC159]|uniref:Uncharacterized protein n=1 Tax=Nocardia pulmonis TaxID=2951408 RepID=A0A9X2E654_9NOCA|nr:MULTISPECIES: hypothetical protein [Nocardia]MCM6774959.1 hypothetical protein [Nocardia pulmonis]MCM6789890.1 hypothetical protein [Nocardia sp. CDC159]
MIGIADIGSLLLVLGLGSTMCVLFYAAHRTIPLDEPPPEPQPRTGVYAIRLRLDHEGATGAIASSPAAHQAMQLHAGCSRDWCSRKANAYTWLVDHGEIVPDSGRTR